MEVSWELLTNKKLKTKKKKSQAAFKSQRALREESFMKYIIFITKLHKWPQNYKTGKNKCAHLLHKRNKSLHLQLMRSDSFWNGYYRWECGMTQTSFLQQYSHLLSDRQWDIWNISPCDLFNINAEKCTMSPWSQDMVEDTTDRCKADFYSNQSTRLKQTFTSFKKKIHKN